jgi:hypothetical protein
LARPAAPRRPHTASTGGGRGHVPLPPSSSTSTSSTVLGRHRARRPSAAGLAAGLMAGSTVTVSE